MFILLQSLRIDQAALDATERTPVGGNPAAGKNLRRVLCSVL
jgi:hypothetical protein